MYVYKDGEIIMEPSCAMPEDAQAGKCVGEELVDLQDGRSGVIRSNRDLSENFRVHVNPLSALLHLVHLPGWALPWKGCSRLSRLLWIPACCLPSTLLG